MISECRERLSKVFVKVCRSMGDRLIDGLSRLSRTQLTTSVGVLSGQVGGRKGINARSSDVVFHLSHELLDPFRPGEEAWYQLLIN